MNIFKYGERRPIATASFPSTIPASEYNKNSLRNKIVPQVAPQVDIGPNLASSTKVGITAAIPQADPLLPADDYNEDSLRKEVDVTAKIPVKLRTKDYAEELLKNNKLIKDTGFGKARSARDLTLEEIVDLFRNLAEAAPDDEQQQYWQQLTNTALLYKLVGNKRELTADEKEAIYELQQIASAHLEELVEPLVSGNRNERERYERSKREIAELKEQEFADRSKSNILEEALGRELGKVQVLSDRYEILNQEMGSAGKSKNVDEEEQRRDIVEEEKEEGYEEGYEEGEEEGYEDVRRREIGVKERYDATVKREKKEYERRLDSLESQRELLPLIWQQKKDEELYEAQKDLIEAEIHLKTLEEWEPNNVEEQVEIRSQRRAILRDMAKLKSMETEIRNQDILSNPQFKQELENIISQEEATLMEKYAREQQRYEDNVKREEYLSSLINRSDDLTKEADELVKEIEKGGDEIEKLKTKLIDIQARRTVAESKFKLPRDKLPLLPERLKKLGELKTEAILRGITPNQKVSVLDVFAKLEDSKYNREIFLDYYTGRGGSDKKELLNEIRDVIQGVYNRPIAPILMPGGTRHAAGALVDQLFELLRTDRKRFDDAIKSYTTGPEDEEKNEVPWYSAISPHTHQTVTTTSTSVSMGALLPRRPSLELPVGSRSSSRRSSSISLDYVPSSRRTSFSQRKR